MVDAKWSDQGHRDDEFFKLYIQKGDMAQLWTYLEAMRGWRPVAKTLAEILTEAGMRVP